MRLLLKIHLRIFIRPMLAEPKQVPDLGWLRSEPFKTFHFSLDYIERF